MFLFWGDELIQFYNDAYRPSLGKEGKHPMALGQKAIECWPEIWDIIYPLIQQVKATGEPTWSEDQLIPIFRNGKLEDVYWTFGYSAVRGDTGAIEGVLVVCHETTEKVTTVKKLQESDTRFQQFMDEAALGIVLLNGPEMRIELANELYARMIDKKWEDIIGQPVFDIIPETEPYFKNIIEQVRISGEPVYLYDHPYYVLIDGQKKEGFLDLVYQPYRDSDKNITGVMILCHDSSEKVIAKRQLEESEQRLRAVIEAAPMPIGIMTGKEMKIAFANQSIKDAWGKGNQVEGKTFSELLPELEGKGFYESLDRVYTTGKAFHSRNERIELMVDGQMETFYYNYSYSPLFDADGNVYGVMNTAANVTDIEVARQKVADSEQQVRSIIHSAPFPIGVYTGPEKTIAFANQSIIDVWGKGNDVIGKTYTEILPELENQEIFDQITTVYETGTAFHARNQRVDLMIDDKLQSFWFNYSFTPLFDAGGKVYGVMNTAAEVTDLNRAKQQIEESERNLRNIILQAPMATCIYSGENSVIRVANNAMFEFWGVEAKDVLGKPVFEAMPQVANQGFEEILSNVRRTGRAFVANEMVATLKRDGKPTDVFINFSLEPIREPDGSISDIMAVAIDVTPQVIARQQIEEVVAERTAELATANKNLHRSNAELEQFAYIASHDLQEPLRKVGTFAQMLEASLGEEIPERAKSYLGKIYNSTERMTGLIRDVLNYSQLSRDEANAYRTVDLNTLIDGILVDYELMISQKAAIISYHHLPTLEASPQQMSQLFSNLISNALKFAKEGIPPHITITSAVIDNDALPGSMTATPGNTYYKIEVTDNGIGFGQEHAARIFNIFQRLHGKTEYSGTGIGLAMCKKIVLNHHGEITATSQPGLGTTFTIILPGKQ
ncbi:MAG: PAS domain-containing protein [Flavipsychrobacter sp.]|nr:PAS domain-containing protein [Flavipsychrobacter sp.]